ncbi:hypothetical protein [Actinoplanes sp. NPDC051851]|uniref:hypothetical protein n=1 Tax=Actinoplanes sp. NPDC051851 TaxID=3154753 RepID=UPI003426CBF6
MTTNRMTGYDLLVRLYPAGHPRDEMLGVLEESGRPWHTEAPSLIVGGLRARTGAGQPVTRRWLYAARAAALMLLTASATAPLPDLRYGTVLLSTLMIATWVCAGLAAAAVVFGARLPAFALATSALVLCATDQSSVPAVAGYTLAAVLLLLPGTPSPVRNPLPILLGLAWSADYLLPGWLQNALLAAVLLWTLIDERVLLAAGLALFAGLITVTDEVAALDSPLSALILAGWRLGAPALLVAIATTLSHHRAKI